MVPEKQQSQRSRSHSINSRNREALLVMTASAALLAGLTTSIGRCHSINNR